MNQPGYVENLLGASGLGAIPTHGRGFFGDIAKAGAHVLVDSFIG
jgi:hypothetical protein